MYGWPTRSHNLKDQVSLPQIPWQNRGLWAPPHWDGDRLDLVQVVTAAESSWAQQFHHVQKTLFSRVLPNCGSYSPPAPLCQWSLGLREMRSDTALICGWAPHRSLLSVLWPVVNFCINCHLLHKEPSPRRSEHAAIKLQIINFLKGLLENIQQILMATGIYWLLTISWTLP